jgi:UDP-3-O-[3-hydroxymyristoyl] N-acetylglucosamine deacetylase
VKHQNTIKNKIFLEGIGVHSGAHSTITLTPAGPNHGITVIHKKFPDKKLLIGTKAPEQAMHATVIKCDGWGVSTIEHLLAALSGLGIDNIGIELDGYEIPIIDGSALPFVQAIEKAGILEQDEQKKYLTPKRVIKFEDNERYIEIEPDYEEKKILEFDYTTSFEHPLITKTQISGALSRSFFVKEIAPARTFGFLKQLPFLRKHGLAQGTTLGNTVVVGEETFLNSLRFKDEFIRHKLLDLVGDLTLLGKPLVGKIRAHKTGHNFNRLVIEHFLNHPDKWRVV